MIIDFDKIPEVHIDGFKGGKGRLDTRNYDDGKLHASSGCIFRIACP